MYNADLNQKQKFTPPQSLKKLKHSPNPGFLIFCGSLHEYVKETNFEKVEACVAKLCVSPNLSQDPPPGFNNKQISKCSPVNSCKIFSS